MSEYSYFDMGFGHFMDRMRKGFRTIIDPAEFYAMTKEEQLNYLYGDVPIGRNIPGWQESVEECQELIEDVANIIRGG